MKNKDKIIPCLLTLSLAVGTMSPWAAAVGSPGQTTLSGEMSQVELRLLQAAAKAANPLPAVPGLTVTSNGKNYTQTFQAAEGKEHTIYWTQGVTPPLMPNYDSQEFGKEGFFKKETALGFSRYWVATPEEITSGIYDVNKVNFKKEGNLCFLATAANMLHWWLDQNADHILAYWKGVGTKFLQEPGLAAIPDEQGWGKLTKKPQVIYGTVMDDYNSPGMSYHQPMSGDSGSGLVNNSLFPKFNPISQGGGYMDAVLSFFINGYDATTAVALPVPEKFSPAKEGGYFHPVFGKTLLTKRHNTKSYDYYNQHMKDWLLSGKAVGLSYFAKGDGKGLHAITIWGAEYDDQGNLCRLYITDSDDAVKDRLIEGQLIDSKASSDYLSSFDVGKRSDGTMYLTTNPADSKYQRPIELMITLDLAEDQWKTVLADQTAPSAPEITAQPQGGSYAKNTGWITLSVEGKVPQADQDKNAYLTYQWYNTTDPQAAGTIMEGKTDPTLDIKIGSDAVTTSYYCVVTNHKYGHKESTTSEIAELKIVDGPVVHAATPVFQGFSKNSVKAKQGEQPTITANAFVSSGTLTYQWFKAGDGGYRFGAVTEPSTSNVFTPPTDKVGTTRYVCNITNTDLSATGQKSVTIQPNDMVTVTVTEADPSKLGGSAVITGTAKYGETLTLDTSRVTGAEPSTFQYQWKRDGQPIDQATGSSYVLAQEDIGLEISCEITSSTKEGTVIASLSDTVAKADGPAIQGSLSSTAPTTADNQDGKINGTDKTMEFDSQQDFSDAKPCESGSTTVPAPGLYYVRIAATETHTAGAAQQVTVEAYHSPEKETVTISFAANGGSGTMESVEVKKGTSYKLPECTFTTPVGKEFNGWDKGAVGTEIQVDDNTTLTAQWKTKEAPKPDGGSRPSPNPENGGSGGGSNVPSSSTETTKHPDGSTTTTVTKPDGSKVETTQRPNGDKTVVETKRDGSSVTKSQKADGTTATTTVDKNGVMESEVKLSSKAVKESAQKGRPVELPTPPVEVTRNSWTAPVVKVDTGSQEKVEVRLPVKRSTPGTVAVVVHKDGTEEVIRKSVVDPNGVTFAVAGDATIKVVENSKVFEDTRGHWAQDAIDFATSHELYNGTSESTFSPDQGMTRGMLAVVLHNLENNPKNMTAGSFGDVKQDDWYADSIQWATEKGIVSGYGNGSFGPNDQISREQLAVMLWRYSGSPQSHNELNFADSAMVSDYAQDAMKWAVENGIISGTSSYTLSPKDTATRAQVATMMMNLMENIK